MSRLHRVVDVEPGGRVRAVDLDGAPHLLMTLAYDGPQLGRGDWVVAHSGFVLCRAEQEDVEAAVAEWTAGTGGERTEDTSEPRRAT